MPNSSIIDMHNLKTALHEAQQSLGYALSLTHTESHIEAQALLRFILGDASRAWLIAHEDDALEANTHAEFEALLKRRLAGEPIAYILGRREFYGLELRVTPATLIPRPDTETLVEVALAKISSPSFPRRRESIFSSTLDSRLRGNDDVEGLRKISVLDLGTGAGAIALAIASERPHIEVTAVDASAAALNIAKLNAEKLALANIRLLQSDWFSALADQTFDVIVSNPPYIAQDDPHLSHGDLRFEPISALTSGPDGLNDIRMIVRHAPAHLKPQGWLVLEHGFDQAGRVAELMRQAGLGNIEHALDLADIARVTLAQLS